MAGLRCPATTGHSLVANRNPRSRAGNVSQPGHNGNVVARQEPLVTGQKPPHLATWPQEIKNPPRVRARNSSYICGHVAKQTCFTRLTRHFCLATRKRLVAKVSNVFRSDQALWLGHNEVGLWPSGRRAPQPRHAALRTCPGWASGPSARECSRPREHAWGAAMQGQPPFAAGRWRGSGRVPLPPTRPTPGPGPCGPAPGAPRTGPRRCGRAPGTPT